MRVVLLRHGYTAANYQGQFLGESDPPLDSRHGLLPETCSYITEQEQPDLIAASPRLRAQQTAHQLTNDNVLTLDWLRELSFGDWEGKTENEIPPDVLAPWKARSVRADFCPPGGEALAALETRVQDGLNDLYKDYNHKTVCLVTHVYVIKAILDLCLEVPTAWHANRLWLTPACFTIVEWSPKKAKRLVRTVNAKL